jgi:hypothetical protein
MVLGTVFQLFQFGEHQQRTTVVGAATSTTATTDECTVETQHPPDIVVEGVALPTSRVLQDDGTPLYRNGHGIRSIPFFGMNIKVYVAHLYSRKPITSEEQALAMIRNHPNHTASTLHSSHRHNPLHFDFTFLRHVGQSRVVSAWTQQLEHSVTHRYDGYEQDRDTFIRLFSTRPIQLGGTQTVQLVGDETRIIDQGHYKGTIRGHDFQKSFLSMWFGEKAVAQDLKQNLLQGHATCRKDRMANLDDDDDSVMWEPLEPLAA